MMDACVAFRILASHAEAVLWACLPTGAICALTGMCGVVSDSHISAALAPSRPIINSRSKQNSIFNLPSSMALRMPQCNLA
jgi:hypothetical protein